PVSDDDEIDLGRLLGALLDAKGLIPAITVTTPMQDTAYTQLPTPIYESNLLLQVEDNGPGGGKGMLAEAAAMFDVKTEAAAEIEIIKSRMVVGKPVDQLHLDIDARPLRLPLIGRAIASRNDALSTPGLLGLGHSTWGAESIAIERFDLPAKAYEKTFLLVAGINGQYTLTDPTTELVHTGRVGQLLRAATPGGHVELLLQELNAQPGAGFKLVRRTRLSEIEALQQKLKVSELGKRSGIINVSLRGDDPQEVVDILNTIGAEYVRQNIERKSEEADKTLKFLDVQLPQLKRELEQAEARYNQFRTQHGVVDLGEEAKSLLTMAVQVQTRSAEIRQKRLEAVARFTAQHPSVQAIASLHGQSLDGIAVHLPTEIECLVKSQGASLALLAIPHANREQRNAALAALSPHKLEVRTVPALSDLASGQVRVADVMELDIEDLLGREQVPPHPLMMDRKVRGKVVMVTGAGGSIGSELCRQLLRIRPAVLLLVELTEFALYSIHAELEQMQRTQDLLGVKVVPLLANVRDPVRMGEILSTWKPQTVYHAAAYKHVPLVEHNPAEGVKNNVTGTLIAALQSALHGVSDFVLVSTDKAVRPTNVMGASKRLAEMVLQAHAQVMHERHGKTRFSMVRFGNVLGSSGSVVPLFRKQIREGGPITLTDENITRYFMTIPEAAQLVIQAGSMAKGGEVFVLDMGDPVRIVDLARQMVTLSGLTVKDDEHPYGDIEIKVTGLRPGEKLYEELLIGDNPLPTAHPRIMKAHEDFLPWDELREWLQRLDAALDVNDVRSIRELLEVLVKDFKPQSDVVDWVWLENARKESAANTPPAPLPVGTQQVA
ncbi:MAG: NAD-dependent epimerase/dehydratase family protein, partial [Limnohabitans sp.]